MNNLSESIRIANNSTGFAMIILGAYCLMLNLTNETMLNTELSIIALVVGLFVWLSSFYKNKSNIEG